MSLSVLFKMIFPEVFQNMWQGQTHEASTTLIPKQKKDTTRKLQINTLMNIEAKTVNKILANQDFPGPVGKKTLSS